MAYSGPDRRKHQMFVTSRTEYHVAGGVCVAVRDLRDGSWVSSHPALGSTLVMAIGFDEQRGLLANRGRPQIGEKLCFSADVVTSPVRDIGRPPRELVARYGTSQHAA